MKANGVMAMLLPKAVTQDFLKYILLLVIFISATTLSEEFF